ncbi:MAG: hypothetical protein KY475_20005 [Planctomycetes bacterium]|nr:hypothetical protein [Planctomycetota bacterium]
MPFRGILCLIVAIAFLSGCNEESGPETHPVTGQVTIDGKPAEGLQITFNPVEAGKEPASGNVGPDGSYTLYTGVAGKPGAPPGKYKITLSDPADTSYMEAEGGGDPTKVTTGRVPEEYKSVETSPKEVEVTAGTNTINIEI